MNRRLLLGVALIAVLYCLSLVLAKPICGVGFTPSLGLRLGWSCVASSP